MSFSYDMPQNGPKPKVPPSFWQNTVVRSLKSKAINDNFCIWFLVWSAFFWCLCMVPLRNMQEGSFGTHLQRRVQNYHPDSPKFDHLTCKRRNIMEAVDGAPFWPAPFLSHAEKKTASLAFPKLTAMQLLALFQVEQLHPARHPTIQACGLFVCVWWLVSS